MYKKIVFLTSVCVSVFGLQEVDQEREMHQEKLKRGYVCSLLHDFQEMSEAVSDMPLKKIHTQYARYLSQYNDTCSEALQYLQEKNIRFITVPRDVHEKIQDDMYLKLCVFIAMHPIRLSEQDKKIYLANIKNYMEQIDTKLDFEIFRKRFETEFDVEILLERF